MNIAGLVVAFLPILLVLMLANLAQKMRQSDEEGLLPTIMAYGMLAVLYGAGVVVGLGLQFVGFVLSQQPGLAANLMSGMEESLTVNWPLLAAGIWIPSVAGILLLLKPVRVVLAKFIPIDAHSPVDAVALSFSMLIVINLMLTLGVGLENLADLLAAEERRQERCGDHWDVVDAAIDDGSHRGRGRRLADAAALGHDHAAAGRYYAQRAAGADRAPCRVWRWCRWWWRLST